MGRRLFQLIVAVMVSAMPMVAAVTPARADNASTLLGLVNGLRASRGVAPLAADPTLTSIASAWSAHMAYGYGLSHNPNVVAQVAGGWSKLGENVGEGGNMTAIFHALVASPFHLANMLDPTYNLTGVGVAVGRLNTLWVTEDFEARAGATPATTVAPTPTPARPATPRPTAPPGHPPAPTTTTAPVLPPTTAPASPPTTGTGTGAAAPVATTTSSAPEQSPARQFAVAAAHGTTKDAPRGWVFGLSALAIVSFAGVTFVVNRSLRPPRAKDHG